MRGQPWPDRCELDEGKVVSHKPVVGRRHTTTLLILLKDRSTWGRPRLDAYGEEADISQPTITAKTVENDPERKFRSMP